MSDVREVTLFLASPKRRHKFLANLYHFKDLDPDT